jgi:radical SAM superfamily enzyme YgiQ (UPF0313 family)
MNMLLLNPPGKEFHARSSRWGGKVNRSGIVVPPIFLATACGMLLKNNFTARIIDAAATGLAWDELDKYLGPDALVVLEVSTPSINHDSKIAGEIKRRYGCKIAYVGCHVSALPEETLKNYPVDFVCVGEYEFTLLEVARALQAPRDYSRVNGLAWRNDQGTIIINPRRELADLDTLAMPAYGQLPIRLYHDPITQRRPYMSIISSRGCPKTCAFCVAPQVMYGRRVRYRSPARVADEIRLLNERFGVREIFFDDDTFTLNKEHVLGVCAEIRNRGLRIDWSCFARCDGIDEAVLIEMKKAGCYMLRFGIETLDDNLLGRMGKNIKVDTIKRSLNQAKGLGFRLHATVMLGYPGETKESISRTLDFVKKSNIDFAQFSIATPYPGTQFYAECKEKNMLTSNSWDDFDGTSNSVVRLETMSPQYLKDAIQRAYREFYFRPGYILKRIFSIRSFQEASCNFKSAFNLIKSQTARLLIIASCLTLLACGCGKCEKAKPKQALPSEKQYEALPTNEWLKHKLPGLKKSAILAKSWLDTVIADPAELRRYGIKGKKKLVELFEAYTAIYKFLPAPELQSLDQRLADIAKAGLKPEYHDMAVVDDKQFDEDSTSYLRLCYLLERKGFNAGPYRQEISGILPRLNARMSSRGINQQMAFRWYYNYFGLQEPFALQDAFQKGIIASRWEPEAMNDTDVYGLTHEIFAVFGYGDNPEAKFFSQEDEAYLRRVLKDLASRYIEGHDEDLTAELLSCMCWLKMKDEPIFKEAVDYLLSSQNPDGSFGNYEVLRVIYEERVKEEVYLHTTEVVLKALDSAFSQ